MDQPTRLRLASVDSAITVKPGRARHHTVMVIYQGTALERQAALPEEEQKQVYADYQGINQTLGVTPGLPRPGTCTPCWNWPRQPGKRSGGAVSGGPG